MRVAAATRRPPNGADMVLNAPIVSVTSTPDRQGYWLTQETAAYSRSAMPGSTARPHQFELNKPIVSMASTPDGDGYWEVGSDGGVFSYGDARFYGSASGLSLSTPVVGIVPTADGAGYWLVASDGGVFTYGDAGFYGSGSSFSPTSPVVGLAPTSDGSGLLVGDGGWRDVCLRRCHLLGKREHGLTHRGDQQRRSQGYQLATANGSIFAFGGAPFYGTVSDHLNMPIIGIAPSASDKGYWLAGSDGGVFSFGDAEFYGSLGGSTVSVIDVCRPVRRWRHAGPDCGRRTR